jgi:diacylglycerol O-acyltransferase
VAQTRASERRRRSFAPKPPFPLHHIPRTSFNVSITSERVFAMTTLPLDELKEVRRATATTLNDVYLAVCGGALRRYLHATVGSCPTARCSPASRCPPI